MEDFVAESDLNCADLAQEVSVEKNFSMWPRDCFCGILVKIVAALCHCLKSLPKSKVKRLKLIALTKEISKKAQYRLSSLVKSHEEHFEQA